MNASTKTWASASSAHGSLHRMPRNLELDRLRALAALLTCYVHWSQVFYPWTFTMHFDGPKRVGDMLSNAWGGVDLFFVISGYIISRTIVGEFDALRKRPAALAAAVRAFYVRRVFRILPIAACVVAIVFACSVLLNEGGYFAAPVYDVQAALAIFTYSFNFWLPDHKIATGVPLAQFWSLSVEEQFYLVFPLFLLLTRTTRQRVIVLAVTLLAISIVIRPFTLADPMRVFFYTQSRCDGLIYGCLLNFATQQPWFSAIRINAPSNRYVGGFWVIVLALALGSVTAIGFTNVVAVPIICALSLALVFLAACEGGIVTFPQPLQWVLDVIGKRSYTLYLVHLPMFYLTMELMHRYVKQRGLPITDRLWPEYTIVMVALVVVATELLHQLVERPMIARGRRLAERGKLEEATPELVTMK